MRKRHAWKLLPRKVTAAGSRQRSRKAKNRRRFPSAESGRATGRPGTFQPFIFYLIHSCELDMAVLCFIPRPRRGPIRGVGVLFPTWLGVVGQGGLAHLPYMVFHKWFSTYASPWSGRARGAARSHVRAYVFSPSSGVGIHPLLRARVMDMTGAQLRAAAAKIAGLFIYIVPHSL